jgi:CheY-like chemotaxis protein
MMPHAPKPSPSGRARTLVPTVLVVDDEEEVLYTLAAVIEEQGWRALTARNGREALAVLEATRPDLMLLDLFMPVMGGIELLHVIKNDERLSHIPRLVMTAANDRMIGVKEDVSVLYKPIDLETLVLTLRRHLEPGAASQRPPALG